MVRGNEVQLIKDKLDIVEYISRYISLKKAGLNYKGLCPFHNENTPSFMVSPELQIFKCFGCGKSGDVISFLMEMEGIDFKEALERLAEETGVKIKKYKAKLKNKTSRLEEINNLALKFYKYVLHNLPIGEEALKYLKNRGLNKKQIEEFELGYAPKSWDSLYKFLRQKNIREEEMELLGLIKKGRGGSFYDTFRGRIIFPLYNENNKLVGFSGRTLYKEEPKYINSKDTPLFKKSKFIYNLNKAKADIKKKGYSIAVEGEFDAITPYIKGIKNIVALKGTAFTQDQAKLLKRYASKTIIFFDNDSAGNLASLRGVEIAQKEDLEVKVALLEGAKDPDEAAKKSVDIIYKAIEDAMPIYDYYFKFILSQESIEEAYGKKRIIEFLMPKILRIKDSIIRAHYLKKLSELVSIEEQLLLNKNYKIIKDFGKNKSNNEIEKTKLKENENMEYTLITYLLWSDTEVFNHFYKKAKKIIKNDKFKDLLEEKKKYKSNRSKLIQNTKYKEDIQEIFLQDMENFLSNLEAQKTIITRLIKTMQKNNIRKKLNHAILQIKEAEKQGDTDKLVIMQKKVKILAKKLTKLK